MTGAAIPFKSVFRDADDGQWEVFILMEKISAAETLMKYIDMNQGDL